MCYKINHFARNVCKTKAFFLPTLLSMVMFMFFNLVLFGQDLISDTQNALPPNCNTNVTESNLIYQTTETLLKAEYFENAAPLELSHEGYKLLYTLGDYIDDAVFLNVDQAKSLAMLKGQADYVKFSLPVGIDRNIEFALSKKELLSSDFSLTDSKGKIHDIDASSFMYYQGVVKDSPGSLAAFTILNNQIRGIVSDENGNYVLGKMEGYDNMNIFYNDKRLKQRNNFECGLDYRFERFLNKTELHGITTKIEKQRQAGGECIRIYIECDYSMYQRFNNSVPEVFDYVSALFNEVALFYANENVKIQLSDVFVWTEPDPYLNFNSSYYVLDEFGAQTQNNFDGDLAHLLTTRNLGNGGLAWTDILCYPYETYLQDWDGDGIDELHHRGPFGISTVISTNVTPFSTYSWDVFVLAHELGHNLGSPHTHACAWGPNGNQTLDNCFTPSGGNCSFGPEPVNGGTIMSYCNVTEYGINFSHGLGEEPGNLIRSRVNAADCLSECPCNLNLANKNSIFDDYTWLNSYVQQNNCNNEVIDVYNGGGYEFLYIKNDAGGELRYQNGTFYCADAGNGTCVDTYNLIQVVNSWACTGNNNPNNSCATVGCTNPAACNYNPNATVDNGSCNMGNTNCSNPCNAVEGCTDPQASNYDPAANCNQGCEYGLAECDEEIFTTFPWISGFVNPGNCSNQKVTVYNMLSYYFVEIESAGVSTLYYQDGTRYCTSSANYSCPAAYNATVIAHVWNCSVCQGCISGCDDVTADNYDPTVTCADNSTCIYVTAPNNPSNQCNETNLFNEFSWLSQLVDHNNCTNETISVYDNGAYSFLYFQKDGTGGFYYQDGTFYCQDNADYSCPEDYNYSSPTSCWSCGTQNSCNQYTGTVFYEVCEDGQYYYFIRLTDGTVVDPYNAAGVNFDYPDGVTVNFDYEPVNFSSPCSTASKAVSVLCIQTIDISGCTDVAACNYDASATVDNGNCDYSCYSCSNNSGTVFYEVCEDGQYYFFIQTDQGAIFDPYNATGIDFTYPNGANVQFDYVQRGNSPCSIADEAVTITCISNSNSIDVFGSYPFLTNIVDENNCGGVEIHVFDFVSYSFLSVDYGTYTELYYQDGTFYCNDCEAAYQFNTPTYTWSCSPANKTSVIPHHSKSASIPADVDMTIYPNPNKGLFTVELSGFSNLQEVQLEVYNVQMQLMKHQIVETNLSQVDITSLNSGLYWLAIKSNEQQIIQKIIIE